MTEPPEVQPPRSQGSQKRSNGAKNPKDPEGRPSRPDNGLSASKSRGPRPKDGGNAKHSQQSKQRDILKNVSPDLKDQAIVLKDKLNACHELFPDWTADDLVMTLIESRGELETAIARISEGLAEQWGKVTRRNRGRKEDQQQQQFSHSKDLQSKSQASNKNLHTSQNTASGGHRSHSKGGKSQGASKTVKCDSVENGNSSVGDNNNRNRGRRSRGRGGTSRNNKSDSPNKNRGDPGKRSSVGDQKNMRREISKNLIPSEASEMNQQIRGSSYASRSQQLSRQQNTQVEDLPWKIGALLNNRSDAEADESSGPKSLDSNLYEEYNSSIGFHPTADSRSLSGWSDAATKASSVTGWRDSQSISNSIPNTPESRSTASRVLTSRNKSSWASIVKPQMEAPDHDHSKLSPLENENDNMQQIAGSETLQLNVNLSSKENVDAEDVFRDQNKLYTESHQLPKDVWEQKLPRANQIQNYTMSNSEILSQAGNERGSLNARSLHAPGSQIDTAAKVDQANLSMASLNLLSQENIKSYEAHQTRMGSNRNISAQPEIQERANQRPNINGLLNSFSYNNDEFTLPPGSQQNFHPNQSRPFGQQVFYAAGNAENISSQNSTYLGQIYNHDLAAKQQDVPSQSNQPVYDDRQSQMKSINRDNSAVDSKPMQGSYPINTYYNPYANFYINQYGYEPYGYNQKMQYSQTSNSFVGQYEDTMPYAGRTEQCRQMMLPPYNGDASNTDVNTRNIQNRRGRNIKPEVQQRAPQPRVSQNYNREQPVANSSAHYQLQMKNPGDIRDKPVEKGIENSLPPAEHQYHPSVYPDYGNFGNSGAYSSSLSQSFSNNKANSYWTR